MVSLAIIVAQPKLRLLQILRVASEFKNFGVSGVPKSISDFRDRDERLESYPDKGIEELGPLMTTLVRNRMLDFLKSGHRRQQMASVEIGQMADQLACGRSVTPEQQVI